MARKKIREYDGKRLLAAALQQFNGWDTMLRIVQIEEEMGRINKDKLLENHSWLADVPLVVKPDMLFGKRGKNDLVLLKASLDQALEFIQARMGEVIEIGGVTGKLTHFVIEPFVPHTEEFYMCIQTQREGDLLSFGCAGGMDIEDNWDKVRSVLIPAGEILDDASIESLVKSADSPDEAVDMLQKFLVGCMEAYADNDCTLLEMNPFTIPSDGDKPVALDIRVEVDGYAHFRQAKKWDNIVFPEPWGREKSEEERYIASLDEKSGASLKLSVLNPKGHLWTMVAGGGASVIYSDTVVDMGYGKELGNYAEYSGNPKEQETYLFARTLLSLAVANQDKRTALIIGGGVANFTDVAATFTGIIQAIKDVKGKLEGAKTKVFVRRGGPNYKTGLRMMEELGQEIDLPIEVFGPETSMTKIVELGIQWIETGL
eukprot:Plantae.Rhodophyta-Purpureofilum_apyrenoidigerum.ctg9390.p1 GENE.Plantae.Rhodophyta-Purpureofilum_apyrenoidigerum.ctg9390~~Plantae.Rhodophyta-Purpureofilum_apyrenoidigerum.ctg9390.p1  ORF type:complete len:430 (+),score=103.36 Plantae.Rhodophyta-Purpureofilum_apyrenoidigerum.ctg9390:1401-2690(+)